MKAKPYMPPKAKTSEHGTPPEVFDPLNAEFGFTLDAAATDDNTLCASYYTAEEDGAAQDWARQVVWCNPPYDAVSLNRFVGKAIREAGNGATVVLLLPAKTDQPWFHQLWELHPGQVEFRWIRGRVKFVGNKDGATFPSVVAIVRPMGDRGE